ncbi:DUF3953 domain-containing protein [Rossellomorea vietnamensis]|uniref:DUF3953 domain-containing protein n=1 Tax=Rossellomorea vietnamensis TaxID=218284 RepID=A0A5D4K9V3_9BACI|nr:DUF3953 domain-containing protein [Rossellomorea vietnamensis]TYR74161.1 DUF3953 domain-containing protein [Rossellomorea vietnamensis]
MLKIIRYIVSLTALIFAAYGLITGDYTYNHIMMLFLSLLMLTMGLEEFERNHKGIGFLLLGAFLFTGYASIQGLLIS